MLKPTFRKALLGWYYRHKRDLPWRNSKDPYIIWLSEIILQQTRVSQGLPYFEKFVKNYPTVSHLAQATETQVMKDWEGLGYYSRARNLHAAARYVSEELGGVFPVQYNELLKLKGVGSYTAAAISSFVAGEAKAVVDGNVYRVLARYFAISTPIDSTRGKKEFEKLANDMLDQKNAADYNQAIMEFGALQCVPQNPDCQSCVLRQSCQAYASGTVGQFPVKEKKKYDRHRYFTFLLMQCQGRVAVQQREGNDVWGKLYQFPVLEGDTWLQPVEALQKIPAAHELAIAGVHDLKPHKLSHQTIHCRIVYVMCESEIVPAGKSQWQWIKRDALQGLAFPRPLRLFLDRKQLTLPIE